MKKFLSSIFSNAAVDRLKARFNAPLVLLGALTDSPKLKLSDDSPFVLVNFGNDDVSRGDCHGYQGIAKRVAEKLNGKYMYIDRAVLTTQFPTVMEYKHQLAAYTAKNGSPDIVFESPANYGDDRIATAKPGALVIHQYNETLTHSAAGTSIWWRIT